MQIGKIQSGCKLFVVLADLVEASLVVPYQVHLVDGHNDVPNTQEGDDKAVSFGLGQNAVACIDKDDCKVGG